MARPHINLSWIAEIKYRWIYVGLGIMVCMPSYFTVWSWWGLVTAALLLLSLTLYFTVERPRKTRLYWVLGLVAGAWIDTLIAWPFGKVDRATVALLAGISVASLWLAASFDKE